MEYPSIGTRIYNHGDMCNMAHFATIISVKPATKYGGEQYELQADEESDREKPYFINAHMISPKYLGNGLSRFVTEESYKAYRAEQMKAYERAIK